MLLLFLKNYYSYCHNDIQIKYSFNYSYHTSVFTIYCGKIFNRITKLLLKSEEIKNVFDLVKQVVHNNPQDREVYISFIVFHKFFDVKTKRAFFWTELCSIQFQTFNTRISCWTKTIKVLSLSFLYFVHKYVISLM